MLVQKWREARGDGEDKEIDAAEDPARHRLQPHAAQQEGPHHGLRRSCLGRRRDRRRVACLRRQPSARPSWTRSSPTKNSSPEETRAFIERAFRDGAHPDDWHRDHQGAAARLTLLGQTVGTARRSSACSPPRRLLREVLWTELGRWSVGLTHPDANMGGSSQEFQGLLPMLKYEHMFGVRKCRMSRLNSRKSARRSEARVSSRA